MVTLVMKMEQQKFVWTYGWASGYMEKQLFATIQFECLNNKQG
jgi:hypothetical protein